MVARTDVSTFFIKLYADLGVAPVELAEKVERQLKDYRIGIMILPKWKNIADFQ